MTDKENRREQFEERAAIAEYDGGLSRAEAERLALDELQDQGGLCPTRDGSEHCQSGSIASGGPQEYCTCDRCF
jgi:hypothetical protein